MEKFELIRLGNIYGFTGGSYADNVYAPNGICPTIRTCEGGNREPMVVEVANDKPALVFKGGV